MIRSATAAISNAHRNNASRLRRDYGCCSKSLRRSININANVRNTLLRSLSSTASSNAAFIAGHQGQSSSTSATSTRLPLAATIAAAAAAATAILTSDNSSPAQNESASVQATIGSSDDDDDVNAETSIRALGKSLQASHERQMVRMAKLLHSLETLAEEAEKESIKQGAPASNTNIDDDGDSMSNKSNEDIQEDNNNTIAVIEDEEGDATRVVIHMSNQDMANLANSPESVWKHIDALKGGAIYAREDVKRIARAASSLLRKEPSLIDLSPRCRTSSGSSSGSSDDDDDDDDDGQQEQIIPLKTVTVVGDLHGHFKDSLCKVLDMVEKGNNNNKDKDGNGLGSPWHGDGAVVFNGDFVDRGENSLEVLLALLLLKLAYPNNVYLNRGNHEDSVIATVYGCSDEIKSRYGTDGHDVHDIWKEFEDVFASLPLAVKTDSAVIMHGGLPSANFTLDQIAQITSEERFKIKTMVEPAKNDDTCRLIQNIMWSDPQPEVGVTHNEDRGCGMKYGPDVVHKFLSDHDLKYLIRSHEPVDAGYELLECDEHGMSAVTVFSAASYPGGAGFNHGAIVRLHYGDNNGKNDGEENNVGDATFETYGESSDGHNLTTQEKMSHTFKAFADVVASHRAALEEEFEYWAGERARRIEMQMRFQFISRRNTSNAATAVATSAAVTSNNAAAMITPEQWADAMKYVLSSELPNVDWLNVRRSIAPGELIDYKRFLNLHCNLSGYNQTHTAGMDDKTRDTILKNHEAIFKVFKFLDVDGDGEVDREEFCRGINELKKRNPDGALSFDAETLFDSIDADKSGTIELAEFQHAFQACDVPYHVAVMMSLDEDKSGTIDRHEFRDGVKLLNARLAEKDKIPESDSEIDKLFDELDESGDGELDMEEFEKFVRVYYPH